MKSFIAAAGLIAAVAAQRPKDTSICDYYTKALLKENSEANQKAVLTLVVNTAIIGNYTKPNVGVSVPGLLAPGTGDYDGVNLLPYFSGGLASTNKGGSHGVSMNFLDGGAADALMMSKPANSTDSAQYTLLTHLYQYFAYLLGCTEFTGYKGDTSMYQVHKFMGLDKAEVGWFIHNVGLSAASFGVSDADVAIVGKALNDAFGFRCSPPAAIPSSASPALQAICIASDCPISPKATCDAYGPVMEPSSVGMSMPTTPMTTGTSPKGNSTMPPKTTTSTPPPYTGDASSMLPVFSGALVAAMGLVAFVL